jgi:hypothetical protein
MQFDANVEPSDLTEIISLFLTKAAAAYAESTEIRKVSFQAFCDRLSASCAVDMNVYATIMQTVRESDFLIKLGNSAPGIGASFPVYKNHLVKLLGILEDSVNGSAKSASLLLVTDDEFKTAEYAARRAFIGTGACWNGGELLGEEPGPNDQRRRLVLSRRIQGFFRRVRPLLDD